jgi:hypothetical protein
MIKGNGLHKIDAPAGSFIQFACDANQTANDDLFIKHLLKNIAQENVDIIDLFGRIADDVYRESNTRQRPLSMIGVHEHKQVYLNFQNSKLNNRLVIYLTERCDELTVPKRKKVTYYVVVQYRTSFIAEKGC